MIVYSTHFCPKGSPPVQYAGECFAPQQQSFLTHETVPELTRFGATKLNKTHLTKLSSKAAESIRKLHWKTKTKRPSQAIQAIWRLANTRTSIHMRKLFICWKSLSAVSAWWEAKPLHFIMWVCQSESFWLSLQACASRVLNISAKKLRNFQNCNCLEYFCANIDADSWFHIHSAKSSKLD